MLNILEKARQHFDMNLPFVLYCKPNSDKLIGFFQQNNELHQVKNFTEKGFIFSNFNGELSFLFPEQECEIIIESIVFEFNKLKSESLDLSEDGKQDFENLVKKGIVFIETEAIQKVVLSRKETLSKDNFNFINVFNKMLSAYQTALRYVWFHPEIGMWMGATPEQLLKVESANFKTVALAGTQKFNANAEVIWQEKERQEQQFVTDFICGELANEVCSLQKSESYTFRAGSVVHLKTDINGTFDSDFDLEKVLKVLHPTPAVCGLPKEIAKEFILANEGYDRKFYAGFLGELNRKFCSGENDDSDLFVNLRCMEIQQNQVHLYIGCGITKDSDPEKEYIETANKAMTMKEILN